MRKRNSNVQILCMTGLFTSVIAIMAQIAIPMPFGVPMTMQSFAVTLAGIILGSKYGALSSFIYILLGFIGLPVFANMTGGWQSLVGPTSGFILTFPSMAYIIGLGYEWKNRCRYFPFIGLILGTSINFLGGILLFCLITNSSFLVGFTTCVLPFLPAAIIKAVLASIAGSSIRRRLQAFL